jgi:hypothetical protein
VGILRLLDIEHFCEGDSCIVLFAGHFVVQLHVGAMDDDQKQIRSLECMKESTRAAMMPAKLSASQAAR